MKPEFTKCWTCPPALPGKRVTLLHRCPPTLCARVPLSPSAQHRTARRGFRSRERQAVAGTVGLGASMKLSVIYQSAVPASASPHRVCDEQGGEVGWANAFLDGQRLRQLSPRSLRIYAYDLLD